MSEKLSSKDQLVLWMGDAPDRQRAAAHAEELVCLTHKEVKRGSEQFYALVLEQTVNPGK